MSSLTEVSQSTKKILKVSGILLAAFFVFKLGSGLFVKYWQQAHPPKEAPPAMRFGAIPKLTLENTVKSSGYSFKLETPTNTLPALKDRVDIYYSPYSKPNLLALEKAKKQALLLGFIQEEKKLTEKNYQWQNSTNKTSLEMNIFNGTFTLRYDWQLDQNLTGYKLLTNTDQAIIKVKQYLAQTGLMPEDLSDNTIETQYMKISGQQMVPAVSQSEASMVKIDFYRQDIEGLPVKTIKAKNGVIQIIVTDAGNTGINGIILINYQYFPIDYGAFSDYPLASSASLWNQFIAGGGYIISSPSIKTDTVTLRRVYMGYIDTLIEQKFLQPVLFFEGDNDFLGFIPALNDTVYKQ